MVEAGEDPDCDVWIAGLSADCRQVLGVLVVDVQVSLSREEGNRAAQARGELIGWVGQVLADPVDVQGEAVRTSSSTIRCSPVATAARM